MTIKLSIVGLIVLAGIVGLIGKLNNYNGPVTLVASNISNNRSFDYEPKTIVITLKASNKQLNKIASDSVIQLLNSNKTNIGYPMASYKINGNTITFVPPILDAGAYKLNYLHGFLPFSVGIQGIKLPSRATGCLGVKNEGTCFTYYFKEKVLRDGESKKALDELYGITLKYPETLYLCHNYSHAIGQMTAFVYDNYQAAIKGGYDVCHFGYYHGVMESFSSLFTTSQLKARFATLCDEYSIGMNRGDCTHGLGHIAWWRSGGNFQDAVAICNLASPNVTIGFFRDKDSCVTGIAMEWSNDYLQATTVTKKIMTTGFKDPTDICREISDPLMASGCWEFIGPVWGGSNKNIAHMISICNTLDPVSNDACWLGIGRDNGFRADVSRADAIKLCLTDKREQGMWLCLSNVVHSKTVTSRIAGTADLVCKMVPKSTMNYANQCYGLHILEKERLGAEGRNQLTGTHTSTIAAEAATYSGDPAPGADHIH